MNLLCLYIICRFIFCQQISVFLLFTKSSTLSDHFIFLLRFQFFIGKDQLVLTDIIIFYEIFFAKLGMVRQKIAFSALAYTQRFTAASISLVADAPKEASTALAPKKALS